MTRHWVKARLLPLQGFSGTYYVSVDLRAEVLSVPLNTAWKVKGNVAAGLPLAVAS